MTFQRMFDKDFPDSFSDPQQHPQPAHEPAESINRASLIKSVLQRQQSPTGNPETVTSEERTSDFQAGSELGTNTNSIGATLRITNLQVPILRQSVDTNPVTKAPIAPMAARLIPRNSEEKSIVPAAPILDDPLKEGSYLAPVTPDSNHPENERIQSNCDSTVPVPTGDTDDIQPETASEPPSNEIQHGGDDDSGDDIRGEEAFQVEALCDAVSKRVRVGKKMKLQKQWLVKWVNYGPEDNTWEPEERLKMDLGEKYWNMLYSEYVKLRDNSGDDEGHTEQGDVGSGVNKKYPPPNWGPKGSSKKTVPKKKKAEIVFPRKRGQARILANKKRRLA